MTTNTVLRLEEFEPISKLVLRPALLDRKRLQHGCVWHEFLGRVQFGVGAADGQCLTIQEPRQRVASSLFQFTVDMNWDLNSDARENQCAAAAAALGATYHAHPIREVAKDL